MKKDLPEYFHEAMKSYLHGHYTNGIRFNIGPLMGLCSGLRKANELGLDYVVYRNGDDWMFNHEMCYNNFKFMQENNKKVAAYNWLTVGTMVEFALNEMILHVPTFMSTIEDAEHYFRLSSNKFLCELKMSRWIKRTLEDIDNEFYRLPNREQEPGIGYEKETLPEIFNIQGKVMPPDIWKWQENNTRFFNREWQLIGSHNNYQRYIYYHKIRKDIPYADELEKEEHFARWIYSVQNAKEWNLPIEKKPEPPLHTRKPKSLVFKMPKKKIPLRLVKRKG
jgi:hypothetical protein